MNPHQKNKVDVKSLSPEEQRLFRLYGKLPSRSDHFAKHLKDRKYFDSGDYAMSKAGKGDGVDAGAVGSQHPVPENIPHLSSPINNGASIPKHGHHGSIAGIQAGSPVKESSFLNRETSAEESSSTGDGTTSSTDKENTSVTSAPLQSNEGIPIRR
ncbi:cAMP-regulated phosphoprotein family protein Igo1 [Pochonia chlamydosporia 170]|uniref:mRNA stability protein n=1 Tax=Pochonia chlamydosporia 170 TaxID=1380566 RepID=A0A179FYF9_METCM|nr:cAMP-regulated phosphoprotein family protein Igo1 [Pochonia chlamydosporia 170]OAQ70705.1 cAMP-regulated phosphoprotein family protein Igo1 [Pochonia chlamydosporia 170]